MQNWFPDVLSARWEYLVSLTQEGVKHIKNGSLSGTCPKMIVDHSADIAR